MQDAYRGEERGLEITQDAYWGEERGLEITQDAYRVKNGGCRSCRMLTG